MTVDLRLREPLFRFSRPTAWPRGVECVLDYDGYILNDRRRLDRIVIENIGGLTGPDLQAEAEKNPDRDGETPYDLNYGGRTITLRGFVQSGTLDTMRDLYSYVLEAFDGGSSPSAERPLWFRWLDWRDYFLDSNALSDYAYDDGEDTVEVSGDGYGLAALDNTEKEIILAPFSETGDRIERYTYGDGEAIARYLPASGASAYAFGVEARRASATQKLRVIFDSTDEELQIIKIDGTPTTLASVACPVPGALDRCWLRARFEGSVITVSMWSIYPPDIGGDPLAEIEHTLSSSDYATYPSSESGLDWGLYWLPSTGDFVEMLDVGAINKGDAVAWCRKAAQAEGDEQQVDGRYTRPFAVALRCSDSRMVSRKASKVIAYPSSFALTFPEDGSGLIFPADGSGLIFGGYLSENIVNLGRSPASPIVRLHGPMTNPVLLNPIDERRIGVDGTIALGDYYEFDTGRRTVVDSSGSSVYRAIADSTSWFSLASGANTISMGADSITAEGLVAPDFSPSVTASTNIFTYASHGLVDGQAILIAATPMLSPPDPLTYDRILVYARDVTSNTFKITLVKGGAALDITSDGTAAVYTTFGYVEFVYRHSSR